MSLNVLNRAQAFKTPLDILIYPELAFSEASEQQVREELKQPGSPSVVVLGSRHLMTNEGRVNRLHAICHDTSCTREFIHDKIGAFGFAPEGKSSQEAKSKDYLFEDIQRSNELNHLLVDGLPISFVICKDVLQESVLESLYALRIRRLIVVALSDKTEDFIHHLSELAIRCNTTSFFSNFTPAGQVTAGVFTPGRNSTAILLRNSGGETDVKARESICENVERVTQPCLATIQLPVIRNDQRMRSRKWYEIHPV
ncbi:MAG: hypothetical protein U1A77_22495 [Pirellulales bacterium]